MIRNGMWDVLSLPDPRNKDNKRGLFLNQSIFSMDYVKLYAKILKKGSKAD